MKKIFKAPPEIFTQRDKIGILLEEAQKHDVFTRQEEFEIVEQIQQGDFSLCEKLFKHNIRFVIFVTKQIGAYDATIPFEDLFMAGTAGLWGAVMKVHTGDFESARNIRFTSFAVKYIQGTALTELHRHNPHIHIPVNVFQNQWKMRKEEERMFAECGEWWDDLHREDALMKKFGHNTKLTKDILRTHGKKFINTPEAVGRKRDLESEIDFSPTAESLLRDNSFLPDMATTTDDFYCELNRLLSLLTDRQREVILLSFGLFRLIPNLNEDEQILYEQGLPLDPLEIGDRLGLTRERVGQIKQKALRRLRERYTYTERLRVFFTHSFSEGPH